MRNEKRTGVLQLIHSRVVGDSEIIAIRSHPKDIDPGKREILRRDAPQDKYPCRMRREVLRRRLLRIEFLSGSQREILRSRWSLRTDTLRRVSG